MEVTSNLAGPFYQITALANKPNSITNLCGPDGKISPQSMQLILNTVRNNVREWYKLSPESENNEKRAALRNNIEQLMQLLADHGTVDQALGTVSEWFCAGLGDLWKEESTFLLSTFAGISNDHQWDAISDILKYTTCIQYLCNPQNELAESRCEKLANSYLASIHSLDSFRPLQVLTLDLSLNQNDALAGTIWKAACKRLLDLYGFEGQFLLLDEYANNYSIWDGAVCFWQTECFVDLLTNEQKEQIIEKREWLGEKYSTIRWVYAETLPEPTMPLLGEKLDSDPEVLDTFIQAAIHTKKNDFMSYWLPKLGVDSFDSINKAINRRRFHASGGFTSDENLISYGLYREGINRILDAVNDYQKKEPTQTH